jgi:hypothetical protein
MYARDSIICMHITIYIDISDLFNELDNLKLNLSCRPDNIHPTFLYDCRFLLSYPILFLFKLSFDSDIFSYFSKTKFVTHFLRSIKKETLFL